MFARHTKKIAIGAGVLGLVLILFGSIWMTAIYPKFEKIPSDWKQVDEFEGTMTTVDMDFVNQLQSNKTINQLMTTPGAQELMTSPAVKSILGNPAIVNLVSNPGLMAMVQDPNTLKLLSDPAFTGLLSNQDVLKLLTNPDILAALADPVARQALMEQPMVKELLADPAIASLTQNTAFFAVLQDGVLSTITTQGKLLELLQNPLLGVLLSNPAVQSLMADPQALALLVDPRTQKLMANNADLPVVTLPVVIRMERQVTDTKGDSVIINEKMITTNSATGGAVLGFDPTDLDLIVDRESREYLAGTEGNRTGLWTLPFHVNKGRSYFTWIPVAQQSLEGKYQGTENVNGLKTYKYVVNFTNVSMPINDPVSGLPMVADESITTWNEPLTGSTVKIVEYDAVSAQSPSGEKYTRLIYDLRHTDDTVNTLVGEAKDNRDKMMWAGSYMPWICIAFGILLAAGAGVIGLSILRSRPQTINS